MSVFSQLSAVRLGGLRWEQQANRIPFRDTRFQGPTLGSGTDRSSNPSARKRISVFPKNVKSRKYGRKLVVSVRFLVGAWMEKGTCRIVNRTADPRLRNCKLPLLLLPFPPFTTWNRETAPGHYVDLNIGYVLERINNIQKAGCKLDQAEASLIECPETQCARGKMNQPRLILSEGNTYGAFPRGGWGWQSIYQAIK